VTFVENYIGVLPILKRNLSNLKITKKYEIIEQNLFVNFNFKIITNKFDIIFLDPPYKERKFNYIIDSITEKKILNKNGIIIIHKHKKDDNKFSDNLKILEEKKYGISKILFGILN
jgi:16S rRNA (guanine966-N2)-methyltransferase